MQVFIVQAFLKKQDLWDRSIDGVFSPELDTVLSNYLEANETVSKNPTHRLLLVEQMAYKQAGLLDKVSSTETLAVGEARAKYALQAAGGVAANPVTPPPATPVATKSSKK